MKPPELSASPDDPQFDAFIASPLTDTLTHPRSNVYLHKWLRMYRGSRRSLVLTRRAYSWNWPAFFIPVYWLIYRKSYQLGLILLALQVIALLLISVMFSALITILISIAKGLQGNALYFRETFAKWQRPGVAGSNLLSSTN